jgi:uncharacterized protein YbcI
MQVVSAGTGEGMNRTRGQTEAEITKAIEKFEKEYMGRGPVETRTYIVEDMVIVRMLGTINFFKRRSIFTDFFHFNSSR